MNIQFVPFHQIAGEIAPNVARHYREMLDKDDYGEPNIDWDYYISASLAGHLLAAVIRHDNDIIAYSVYTIAPNPRYKHILQATNEAVYIELEHRGKGLDFLKKIDDYLKDLGVKETSYVWANDRLAKVLARLGYKAKTKVWSAVYE